jgi:hypothetical protein
MGAARPSEAEASPTSRNAASRTEWKARNERRTEDVFIIFSRKDFKPLNAGISSAPNAVSVTARDLQNSIKLEEKLTAYCSAASSLRACWYNGTSASAFFHRSRNA